MQTIHQAASRSRGRPRGSGKRDELLLQEIADTLRAAPGMKPTTAIRQILTTDNPSNIRRLQIKWKKEGAMFREQAALRHDIEPYDPVRHAFAPIGAKARINPNNAALWDHASLHGWHTERGLNSGDYIIRRDLWRVLGPDDMPAFYEQCNAYFASLKLDPLLVAALTSPSTYGPPV